MKIIKYKKVSSNKYVVFLENNEKINLYEDVILKEGLLLKKEIDDLSYIKEINNKYAVYDNVIKFISRKMRSILEVRKYLEKQVIEELEIDKIISKLINDGYLNDELYAKAFINDRFKLSMDGPFKIKKDLENLDINSDIFYKYFSFSHDDILEKINRYLNKELKVNKKSHYVFQNKMLLNLSNLGYEHEDIMLILNNLEYPNDDSLKEREKEKITKKLSKKYSGYELERKVKEKLYQKGFFD